MKSYHKSMKEIEFLTKLMYKYIFKESEPIAQAKTKSIRKEEECDCN